MPRRRSGKLSQHRMRWLRSSLEGKLSEAAEVDGISQDSDRLLGGMEAHRVLRHDEVDHELALSLVLLCLLDEGRVGAVGAGRLDIADEIHQCIEGDVYAS